MQSHRDGDAVSPGMQKLVDALQFAGLDPFDAIERLVGGDAEVLE